MQYWNILETTRKRQHGEGIKILTLKQKLERLPIALSQNEVIHLKTGITSKNYKMKLGKS